MPKGLPFELKDYIQLVDHTGRAIRDDKRGYISKRYASILTRLNIEEKETKKNGGYSPHSLNDALTIWWERSNLLNTRLSVLVINIGLGL